MRVLSSAGNYCENSFWVAPIKHNRAGLWWHMLRIPYKRLAFSVVRLLILPANVYDLKILMGANQYEFGVFSETGVMTPWLRALTGWSSTWYSSCHPHDSSQSSVTPVQAIWLAFLTRLDWGRRVTMSQPRLQWDQGGGRERTKDKDNMWVCLF